MAVTLTAMATEWSDDIVISELADEPALSDELNAIIDRIAETESPPHVVLNLTAVTYVGSVGRQDAVTELDPVFAPIEERCDAVIPLAAPGLTSALEFDDDGCVGSCSLVVFSSPHITRLQHSRQSSSQSPLVSSCQCT